MFKCSYRPLESGGGGGGIKFDILQIETNNVKVGNNRKLKTISKFSKAYYYL